MDRENLPDRENMNQLDPRKREDLTRAYEIVDSFVKKNYLSVLSGCRVVPLEEAGIGSDSIRLFKINKLVYDKKEDIQNKLGSVYSSLENIGSSLIFVLDSDGTCVKFYIGVRVEEEKCAPSAAMNTLQKSFYGHFPGSNIEILMDEDLEKVIAGISTPSSLENSERVISSVSSIPSFKDEDKEKFVQGIEKFIDAMQGEKYSAVFIADPVSSQELEVIRTGYQRIYSQLVPFAKTELNFSENESESVATGLSEGFTETVNSSISESYTKTSGSNYSTNESINKSTTRSPAGIIGALGTAGGFALGGPAGAIIGGMLTGAVGGMIGSKTEGETQGITKGKTESESKGQVQQEGKAESISKQESQTETWSTGNSRSLQMTFEQKNIKDLLELIDEQLKRIRESQDFGLWNTACYFISDDRQVSEIAASNFKAITRGENSSLENSHINTWDNIGEKTNLKEVGEYLRKLRHPCFEYDVDLGLYNPYVTAGSLISGRELTIPFGLPRKSISGIPVIESTEFGRDIVLYDKDDNARTINMGKIYHMGQAEDKKVRLDLNSLAMHTFITGSTGAGKSNTIFNMLYKLNQVGVKFLVVEPAKGEYKQIFGGRKDVNVFGTNNEYSELLRINPFKFPEGIHVLEHIDRLVEIFNACWPMYAAMPAILKKAIEYAYEFRGWDLDASTCLSDKPEYPAFKDLLETLPAVINESGYSDDTSSDYTGALITRVESLTNGLIGRIFAEDELDNNKLFNENCIVDISRVGSMETKSLIMGIIFLRLNEDRFAKFDELHGELKHETVLEEAHNLLRRTSAEQSQESSNLQGKAVEMISNAIAEMRAYGEGFIIADQSPGLLDQSVIKNTNTKIILRLPEEKDRNIVGKSAGLNEDQINELNKLKTGVAAIYQNNWLQPILCAIDRYDKAEPLRYKAADIKEKVNEKKGLTDLVRLISRAPLNEDSRLELDNIDLQGLKTWLLGCDMDRQLRDMVIDNVNQYQEKKSMDLWDQECFEERSKVLCNFIDKDRLIRYAHNTDNYLEWTDRFKEGLKHYIQVDDAAEVLDNIVKLLIFDRARQDEGFKDFYFNWVEKYERRNIL